MAPVLSSRVLPTPQQTQLPPNIHDYLPHHPDITPDIIYVQGREMSRGYRPPLAPKPLIAQPVDRFQQSYIDVPFISHRKSDSVDSSDGLRNSASHHRGDASHHLNNREYLASHRADTSDRTNFPKHNDKPTPPPTPPPRAYKLVNGDNKNAAILVPEQHIKRPRSRAMNNAPGSRYGSSSSINHLDYGTMNMIDYRTNLGQMRSTLHNNTDSSNFNCSHSSVGKNEMDQICDCGADKSGFSLSSRTPSMTSIRSVSRNSNSSAKNALLKEKLLGPRPNSVRVSAHPSTPPLPKAPKSGGRRAVDDERNVTVNANMITVTSPPPHPFSAPRDSRSRHSSVERKQTNSYESRHREKQYGSTGQFAEEQRRGNQSATSRISHDYSKNASDTSHPRLSYQPDHSSYSQRQTSPVDEVDHAQIMSPSKVSLLANKFNTAIKDSEDQALISNGRISSASNYAPVIGSSEAEKLTSRPPSSRSIRSTPSNRYSGSKNTLEESRTNLQVSSSLDSSRHSHPLAPPPSASSGRHPPIDDGTVINREEDYESPYNSSQKGSKVSPPHSAGKIVVSSGSDSGIGGSIGDTIIPNSSGNPPPQDGHSPSLEENEMQYRLQNKSVPPTPYGSPVKGADLKDVSVEVTDAGSVFETSPNEMRSSASTGEKNMKNSCYFFTFDAYLIYTIDLIVGNRGLP